MQYNAKTIRVAVYNASERYCGYTTGIGKHVNNMVAGLAKQPGFAVKFWVPIDHWSVDQNCRSDDQLFEVESACIPVPRRTAELLSLIANLPKFERFAGKVDWVYCPREVLVSTSRAATAVTIHDVYPFEPDQRKSVDYAAALKLAMWTKAAQRATLVLTVSEFSKSRICDLLGLESDRVEVVGNGVEQVFFDIAHQDPGQVSPLPGEKYFFSVGGVSRKKGGSSLLRFASLLERQGRNVRLAVLGPVEDTFKSAVESSRSITIVDRGLKDAAVARWMRGSIAVLLFSEYEGFGIPALEAMAAGVPVVGNRKTALPEVIGDAGLVINAHAMSDLEGVAELYLDDRLRENLTKRGLKRAQGWRWEKCVDTLANLLRRRIAHS